MVSSTLRVCLDAIPRPSAGGWRNLKAEDDLDTDRVRKKGGGRRKLIEIDAALEENFFKVIRDHTAGDPMRADVGNGRTCRGKRYALLLRWERLSAEMSCPSYSANTSIAREKH